MNGKYIVKTPLDMQTLSSDLLDRYKDHRVFVFHGDLGAGKTTLVKAFLHSLGSQDEVNSPTFSIVNQYVVNQEPLYHFDLYRINSLEELEEIGFFEYLDSGHYVFIEWPEIAEEYIDLPHVEINLEILEDNSRNVIILEQ